MNGGLPPISSSWRQAPWGTRPVTFLSNWTFAVIVLMQHPLCREDGSRLQLLLILASAVILRSESRGTYDHILLSQIRYSLFFTASRTEMPDNWFCPLLITSRHGPRRNTPLHTVTLVLLVYSLQRERVYRAVAQKWLFFLQSPLSNESIRHNMFIVFLFTFSPTVYV
jgi:hypothetical protein